MISSSIFNPANYPCGILPTLVRAQQCVQNGASAGIVGIVSLTFLTFVNILGLLGRSALPPFHPLNRHKSRVWELTALLFIWLFALAGFSISVYNAVKACDKKFGGVWSIPLLNILRAVYGALQAIASIVLGHYKYSNASANHNVMSAEVTKEDASEFSQAQESEGERLSSIKILCWASLIALGGYTFIAPLALLHFGELSADDHQVVAKVASWIYVAYWAGSAALYAFVMIMSQHTPLREVSLGKRAFMVLVILGGMLMPIFVEMIVSLTYRTTLIVPPAWNGIFLWLGLSQHFILFTQ